MCTNFQACFNVNEAALYLRISRATLYKLIQQKKISPTKIGARTIILAPELERFLAQAQVRTKQC
jgi:excisionase family DNA binding protein